jgi:tetratricopeptide (TPR) repeat protein
MPCSFTSFACGLVVAIAVTLPLASAPAHSESALSGRVNDQLMQLYRFDFNRRLKTDFEERKRSLGTAETAERAAKLREMFKERASYYESVDDIDNAKGDYDALIKIRPVNPDVYLDRGDFLMRQRQYADAERDFMAGARLAPDRAAFSFGAGRALAGTGEYIAAMAQYDEAIRLAPDDGMIRLARGEADLKLGKHAEARLDYDRALALGLPGKEERFLAYFGRGYAAIVIGDFVSAIRDFDAALALRPGTVSAVVWRGYARERMGERERALADYETALRITPDDPWIRSSVRRMRS